MTTKSNRSTQTLIRITIKSRDVIRELAADHGLAQITILEYLLKGKINTKEFKRKYDKYK